MHRSLLVLRTQYFVHKILKFLIVDEPLVLPGPVHQCLSPNQVYVVVRLHGSHRVSRNFLYHRFVDSRVYRPIKVLPMRVGPNVKQRSPGSSHEYLCFLRSGGWVIGMLCERSSQFRTGRQHQIELDKSERNFCIRRRPRRYCILSQFPTYKDE